MVRQPEASAPFGAGGAGVVAPPRGLSHWVVEDKVSVAVDGSRVWDAEEERPEPAVVVRMPAHVARHLARVLDDWSTIGRLLESSRGADEHDLAGVLHEAAKVADTLRQAVPEAPPD